MACEYLCLCVLLWQHFTGCRRHFGTITKMCRCLTMSELLWDAIQAFIGGKRWRGFLQGELRGYSYTMCDPVRRGYVCVNACEYLDTPTMCLSMYCICRRACAEGVNSAHSTNVESRGRLGGYMFTSHPKSPVTKCGWVLSVDSCRGLIISPKDT